MASVPQRSPFRYPEGKTWLVPQIRKWLISLHTKPEKFVEPFAGGGIVALTVAFESLSEKVIMVELDHEIASVWKVVLCDDAKWLAERIAAFDLTADSVQVELDYTPRDVRELAFQTLLRNRVSHGGILAPGSGVIRYGENGRGISSRWYPQTLQKRILDIAFVRDRIEFIEGDGMDVLTAMSRVSNAAFFIDPPYTAAGKRAGTRLYKHNELDHERLFQIAESLQSDFLMTYDNNEEVAALARRYSFDALAVPMKNTHHTTMTELLIGKDLDWARR